MPCAYSHGHRNDEHGNDDEIQRICVFAVAIRVVSVGSVVPR